MSITCAINDPEIIDLLFQDICVNLRNVKPGETFDYNKYMQDLYRDFAAQGTPESAAKYLQSVPRLISIAKLQFYDDIELSIDELTKLGKLYKSEKGINEIINTLSEKSDMSLKKAELQNEQLLKFQLLEEVVDLNKLEVKFPNSLTTISPFSGTLQSYISFDPNSQTKQSFSVEQINPEKLHIVNTLAKLKNIAANTDSLNGLVMDGKKVMFLAQNLNVFANEENFALLDTETKNQIVLSRSISADKAPQDVIQIQNRAILILSDESGKPIFVNEDGEITSKEEGGKLVYQFLRTVRKEGDRYKVTNIYNTDDSTMTAKTFAETTYDPKVDGTEDEYYNKVDKIFQANMKLLYDFQQKVIGGEEVLVPITGVSTGVPTNLSNITVSLNNLLKFPTVSETIIKTIKTEPKTTGSVKKGFTYVTINGNKFNIDLMAIPDSLAAEIAEVLLNPKVNIQTKKEFTDIFLPSTLDANRTYKKFELFYDKDGKFAYFNIYDDFGKKAAKNKDLTINLTPGKIDQAKYAEYKERIIQYLTSEGKKNGNRVPMSYNNEALNDGTYLMPTDKGFVKKNYFDLIREADPNIKLINADPGFYNFVAEFALPDTTLNDIINSKAELNETESFEDILAREKKERQNDPVYKEATRIIETAKSDTWRATVANDPTQKLVNPTDEILVTGYFINQIKSNKAYTKELVEKVKDEIYGAYWSTLTDAQRSFIDDQIAKRFPGVKPTENTAKADVIQNTTVPGAESPTSTNSPVNQLFNGIDFNSIPGSEDLYRRGIKKEFINPLKIAEAKKWWNSKELEPLRKLISLEHMANLVNSDVYARFIVAGAQLADGTMGTIKVNKKNGTFYQNLTVYHEAWHVFSQLFLTKADKVALYEELQNYTDAAGNKPYAKMSYLQLEEMLAEDFRNYVKTGKAKEGAPKRNTLFRRILNFLKELFGKVLNKFNKQNVEINSLNSPMAKELFDKLYLGQFNSYQASVDNALLYELDRGPAQISNPKEDFLSPADGMLMVESIDSIFSEIIDNIYQNNKMTGNSSLKSASILMLIDPNKRGWMYNNAKTVIENRLKTEREKLQKSKKLKDLNDINTIEDLKANAVAVLKNKKSSKNKYFFLSSQVSDFSNLSASFKRGDRVKGEDYRDAIGIVGDYYKHNNVIVNGKPAEVIIISRPKDAEIQFQNYIAGEAINYTGLTFNTKLGELETLTQEQELVRDNIRILQSTLDNWGDETSGMIKYHMQNTDYEVVKTKYDVVYGTDVNEEGEEINPADTNSIEEANNDLLQGKLSLQQMMSKETNYILKSLFKVVQDANGDYYTPTNRLGFKERADFAKVFSILAKSIGGIRNREEAYKKLGEEAKKFPEIKQLYDTKFPDPTKITNTFEFDISMRFFHDFAKPRVKYMQLFAFTEEGQLDFQVKESSISIDNTLNRWSNGFTSSTKTPYIQKSKDNVSSLDLAAVVKDFGLRSDKDNLEVKKQIEFAKAIGIDLENNTNIKNALDEETQYYGLQYMYDIVVAFNKMKQLIEKEPTSKYITNERKKYLEKFKANPIDVLRTGIPSGVLPSMKGTVKELTQLKRLAELQSKYGYDSATTAVLRANGNIGYQDMNWSTAHAKANALNSVTSAEQLWNDPNYNYMSYLNPEINTYTRHLKIWNSIFNGAEKRAGASVQIIASDGFSVLKADDTSEGNTLTELDPFSKFIYELHTTLLGGISEFPRHSEKKFAYGFKLQAPIKVDPVGLIKKGDDRNLYVDMSMFNRPMQGEYFAIGGFLMGYIQGEFDRIKKFRGPNKEKYLSVTQYNNIVGEKDGQPVYAGQVFTAFDDMLTDETKEMLYELADQQIDVDLINYLDKDAKKQIANDIIKYFNNRVSKMKSFYFDNFGYISKSLLVKLGYKEDELTAEKIAELTAEPEVINKILQAYAYNDWIHKFETSILMYGDFVQWNHDKEDWSKRIPGLTSDGTGFAVDPNVFAFINNVFNNETTYAHQLAKETGEEYDNFVLNETINTAIIADAVRESIYLDDMVEAWTKEYSRTYDQATIDKLIAKDKEAFESMKEGDGMAYMTLDAYRTLHKIGRGWTLAQESLYQKIIKKIPVDPKEVKQFFPVYKLHYFGAIANDLLPVTGMHKFAVIPLIPGVNATEGSELDKLHKKMLKDNIQYITFDSGSKGATLTTDGKLDDIFTDDAKKINTEVSLKKNPIYLANLKEVTVMNDYFKENLPIATQTRGIVIDNLFENGELINPKNKTVIDNYNKSIADYTAILKEELLNNIGFELVDGRYVGNITEFVELIRNELTQRDTPAHLVKLVNTTLQKELAMDLSLHPESDSIEKLLMSVVQRGLIKQETKGEPLIQTPTTFTNGIWDNQFKAITDLKEIKKVLGTNTLPFYQYNKDGRTEEMKVAIALQGDFINLLKAKDLQGNEIGTIDRLNELVKDPEWFAKNKKSITLFGPRIPNDATNTIEAATVWHFLSAGFGNSIIIPTEIVAKAGSDFDGDKLFMSMPNIDVNGDYVDAGIANFDEVLKQTKELEKNKELEKGSLSSRQLINIQKKYLQNKYREAAVEILMLPENYAYLTKPNGMYLVDIYVDDLQKYRKGFNRYERVHNETPKKSAPKNGKTKTVISPTRVLEVLYNVYKHDANLSLEPSLGILAKLAKSHPIYKAAGAKMPANYNLQTFIPALGKSVESKIVIPMEMRFAHNTTTNSEGEKVISLSGERTQKGTRISDLISHNLQGVLDRAKESFPFDLKLIPEAMDVLSFMIQAGVDEEQIFLFLNQPAVVDYFDKQRLMNGSMFKVINAANASVKNAASQQVYNEIIKNVSPEELTALLDKISVAKLKATLSYLKTTSEEYNVYYTAKGKKFMVEMTGEQLATALNNKEYTPESILQITLVKNGQKYGQYTKLNENSNLVSGNNISFTSKVLSNIYIPNGKIDTSVLKNSLQKQDNKSMQALALFANFLELEQQWQGMKELQTKFSPDTQKLTTIQQVLERLKIYKKLEKTSSIDKETLENLTKNSILSSFVQDEIILDLAKAVFNLKLNPTITNYISSLFDTYDTSFIIKSKFGFGVDGQERFTNAFNNAIINYIYQNYLSQSFNRKGEIVNIPENYDGYDVVVDDTLDIDANLLDDKIVINSLRIETDYAQKAYLNISQSEDSYANRGLDTFAVNQDPFPNLNTYYKYVIAREALSNSLYLEVIEQDPIYKAKLAQLGNQDDAIQSYLSEKALEKANNPAYILGKTKYSYTDNLLNMVRSMSDSLKSKYDILLQLSLTPNAEKASIVKLNNRKEAQGNLAETYYKQIKDFANPAIMKVDDELENQRISEMFQLFSTMMYYQHGVGKSGSSFVKILNPSEFKNIITDASQAFIENYLSTETLDNIFNRVMTKNKFKNYVDNISRSKHNIEEIDLSEGVLETVDLEDGTEEQKPKFVKGNRVVFEEDVKLYNRVAKTGIPNRFFTQNTTYSAFYNEATGKREKMPQSTVWLLNEQTGYYYMVEQDPALGGEIYYDNVDLSTGYQRIPEGEQQKQPTGASVSTNNAAEYTNHSGGAYGGDTFWDVIGREFGVTNHKHYREASNVSLSAQLRKAGIKAEVLTKEQMDTARAEVEKLLGKKYPDTTEGNLQVRNYYQVANADAVYAIAEITQVVDKDAPKNTTDITKSVNSYKHIVKGGTNTAVQLGIKLGKPVYVWDLATESWYKWDGNRWFEETTTPILTKNFAGVGSRDIESYNVKNEKGEWVPRTQYKGKDLEEAAKQAIRDVYENTFKTTTQPSVSTNVEVISPDYGVVKAETNPTESDTQQIINLIAPQIEKQAYKENVGGNANWQFSFGNMWSRVNLKAKPLVIDSFAGVSKTKAQIEALKKEGKDTDKTKFIYDYHELDQDGNPLPSLSELQPLIDKIQNALGIDMSDYDSMLGNIYLDNQSIAPHRDTTEAKSAEGYPVIVYTIGNDSGLGIWDDNKGKITFQGTYKQDYQGRNPTNEIPTTDGTIYTFGMDGKGRFALSHTTPLGNIKKNPFPPIKLSDGRVITNYTITLTFRRAADLTPGMPKTPAKITTQPTVEPVGEVKQTQGSDSIQADMNEFNKLVSDNNGELPKTFTVGIRKWILNPNGNYDLVDSNTGQIYMRNVNMETGKSMPESSLQQPVNPKVIAADIALITSMKDTYAQLLADLGYDVEDILDKLAAAKTIEDYNKIKEILDKLC